MLDSFKVTLKKILIIKVSVKFYPILRQIYSYLHGDDNITPLSRHLQTRLSLRIIAGDIFICINKVAQIIHDFYAYSRATLKTLTMFVTLIVTLKVLIFMVGFHSSIKLCRLIYTQEIRDYERKER